jgi:hypothetical protein
VGLAPLASHFLAAAPSFALRVPEFESIAYVPGLMRRPWRICPTNALKFSKRRGELNSKEKTEKNKCRTKT